MSISEFVWLPKFLLLLAVACLVFLTVKQVQPRWLRVSIQAIASVFFGVSVVLLFLLVLVLVGCSKTLITSRAPNRSATVRVKQVCFFPDCLVNVTVQIGWWTEKRIASRSDCIVNFAHVAWSPDSRIAAIFVDNGYCSSIHEGYDVRTSSMVPFAPLADQVRRSIISEYRVRPNDLARYGGDVFEWAHDPGDGISRPGAEAFRKKYGPDRWP